MNPANNVKFRYVYIPALIFTLISFLVIQALDISLSRGIAAQLQLQERWPTFQ